jgi:methionyl-tRNA formyltransferase
MKPLSFAVMLNEFSLKHWQNECLQLLEKEGYIPSLIIVNATNKPFKISFKQRLKYLLYNRIERYLYKKQNQLFNYHPQDIPVVFVYCKAHAYKSIFDEKSVEQIKQYSLDFILRFGFNVLSGEILNCAKHGIWSFHHNQPEKIRGGPPVFWEIIENHDTVGFILQQLTEKLDAGFILARGEVELRKYAPNESYDNLMHSSKWALRNAVLQLANNTLVKEKCNSLAKVYKRPNNGYAILFLLKWFNHRLQFYYSKYIQKAPYWQSFARHKNQIIAFQPPSINQFTADIFPVSNANVVLAEVFSFNIGKAKIGLYNKNGNFIRYLSLNPNLHFSFPFTIYHEGKNWLLPECPTQSQLKIYALNVAFEIEEEHVILNQNLCDAILFHFHETWFLIGTEHPYQQQNLKIFYADSLLGNYKPHFLQPVKMDVTSARNAGRIFYKNGKWIRPVMDNVKEYGGRLRFFEIEKLSKTEFKESEVSASKIVENFDIDRVHTFHIEEDSVYFDKKKS